MKMLLYELRLFPIVKHLDITLRNKLVGWVPGSSLTRPGHCFLVLVPSAVCHPKLCYHVNSFVFHVFLGLPCFLKNHSFFFLK